MKVISTPNTFGFNLIKEEFEKLREFKQYMGLKQMNYKEFLALMNYERLIKTIETEKFCVFAVKKKCNLSNLEILMEQLDLPIIKAIFVKFMITGMNETFYNCDQIV